MAENVSIPTDIYESPREIVIVMPLGGVSKKSIELYFDDFTLYISGDRELPSLKSDLSLQQSECYWGPFTQEIQLPPYVYFEHIRSEVTAENILLITIPKALQPGKMKIDVVLKSPKAPKKIVEAKSAPKVSSSKPVSSKLSKSAVKATTKKPVKRTNKA